MPKVSIIIPTYNGERFIDKTIQSVIDQTYKDWELIIVDDFSKDNTRKIITDWQKKDARIQTIFLTKNSGGPAHPKNAAMAKAKGKYIAYLDHDDEWLPEKLEKQISTLESNSKIGLISCEALTIDMEDKIIDKIFITKIPNNGLFPSILFTDYISSNSSLIIPREVIDKIGDRDENPKIGIAEDREFELRVASANYQFYVIHEPLFKYRVHNNNSSKLGTIQGLHYAEANLKYISYYKKYHLEFLVYRRLAREYLKLCDISNAKKYCKLTFIQKKDLSLIIAYILLFFGKYGAALCQKMLTFRTKLLYQ